MIRESKQIHSKHRIYYNILFCIGQYDYFVAMEYKNHLNKDKKLATILIEHSFELNHRKNVPLQLMSSIMSQQLSTKVAEVIFKRFIALYDPKEPTPQQVLDTPAETLRSIGLSGQKAAYIHNVASFFLAHKLTDARLHKMDNETILATLTQIKGVGKWTTEMLLMFTLGREDIFPVDDLGIQQGMSMLYKISMENKKEMMVKMEKLSQKWKPYRTYACLHIWKWKDEMKKQNKPL